MFRAALATALVLVTMPARADKCPRAQEADLTWKEAQAMSERGEHGESARRFARADELCPHPDVLDRALEEVEQADEPLLCSELVERALARGHRPTTTKALGDACRQKLGGIVVRCPGKVCAAKIDGNDARLHDTEWVMPGRHVVDLVVDGAPKPTHELQVEAGTLYEVPPPPPPPRPRRPPPPPAPDGIHAAYFFASLGLTLVSGALLVWSGVDALDKNDEFKETGNDELREEGRDAQLRTNVLIGVTGGLAVLTGVLGLFTDWSFGQEAVRIEVEPGAGFVTVRAPF